MLGQVLQRKPVSSHVRLSWETLRLVPPGAEGAALKVLFRVAVEILVSTCLPSRGANRGVHRCRGE